jgi:salicylate hydroxylase
VAPSVAVVGGGIGGLTTAVALLHAGLDVRVYEQARTLPAVGAGIQLAPNCTRILGRLGLLPAVERVAVRPTAFEFRRWDDGRVLSRTPLGDSVETAYGAPYLHAHRGDLVALLADAVPADRVEVGRRCVGVGPRGERAEVVFADGSRTTADVVVGADGIHSAVRQSLFGDDRPRFTGHVAYRGLIPADRLAHLGLEPRCTVRLGPGAHVVHYFVSAGRLVNVVCVTEENAWRRESWTDRGDVAELRAAFQGWHPVVREIVGTLDAPLKWALFDRDPLPCWSPDPSRSSATPVIPCSRTGHRGTRKQWRTGPCSQPAWPYPQPATSRPRWPATPHCAATGPPVCRRSRAGTVCGSTSLTGRSSGRATRRWRRASGSPRRSTGCTGTIRRPV